jgi:hypothetical protein
MSARGTDGFHSPMLRTSPKMQLLTFSCLSELKCWRGHVISMKERGSHWTCDVCNVDMSSRGIKNCLRCEQCDYDVCAACQKTLEARLCDLLQSPLPLQLPEVAPDMRRDLGGVTASLWAAIEEGDAEAYSRLAQGLPLPAGSARR